MEPYVQQYNITDIILNQIISHLEFESLLFRSPRLSFVPRHISKTTRDTREIS